MKAFTLYSIHGCHCALISIKNTQTIQAWAYKHAQKIEEKYGSPLNMDITVDISLGYYQIKLSFDTNNPEQIDLLNFIEDHLQELQ